MGDLTGAARGFRVMDPIPIEVWRTDIDRRLEVLNGQSLAGAGALYDSVRYSACAPGKRLRALLLLAAIREFDQGDSAAANAGWEPSLSSTSCAPGDTFPEAILDLACAVELIHAASLIFDDLPSMDNASLRRGQPANHIVFGESTAILAGISLLSQAFGLIAGSGAGTPEARNRFVAALSEAVGVRGLAAGQQADLDRRVTTASAPIGAIHAAKTGVLFAVAAQGGGLIAGANEADCTRLHGLGLSIGLAFQAFDDVLDAAGSTRHTGKDVGQDQRLGDERGTVVLARARVAIRDHLGAVEDAVNDLDRGNQALRGYTRHLRAALERHLRLCNG